MKITKLKTPSATAEIFCGEGAFEKYAKAFAGDRAYIITDSNVFSLYKALIEATFENAPVYVIKAGEKSKSHNVLFAILKDMLAKGVTRSSTVVALGGGVVGDIAGLAACLYMRGVKLVQIPTTLLSQVDSSVGGKTAVDLNGVKNVIGAFYQPRQVIVDSMFLKTLPARELRCGLGEIVKYGGIDGKILTRLEENYNNLFDYKFLEDIAGRCIDCKARVVAADERDTLGVRKSLNLGHTTGHAFELYYKRKSHGEFVLIGMYYELYIAVAKGVCEGAYADRLIKLIKKVIKKIPAYNNAAEAALNARYDKKNSVQSQISLIVPTAFDRWEELVLPVGEYAALIGECAKQLFKEQNINV